MEPPPGRTLRIGSDHVMVREDRLVVVSRADMEHWQVGRHRHALIRFEHRDWRVVGRTPVPPDAIRYELAPWEGVEHAIVAVDAAVRWGRIIGEQRPPPGFYEWIVLRSNDP